MAEAPKHMLKHYAALRESQELVERIRPLLAGKTPEVQGAALADLVAIHIASHISREDERGDETDKFLADLLVLHTVTVAKLIPAYAKTIRAELLKSKC